MFIRYQSTIIFAVLATLVSSQTQKPKVAIVTGGNKGIGYEIVKGLCERFNGHVYLTARDETRGKAAVHKLRQLGLNPYFYQLDVTDPISIQRFRNYINGTEGGIDILINNAAIGYFDDNVTSFKDQVESTMKVNYFGLLEVSNALSPLLRRNARVVNLSSQIGALIYLPSHQLRSKLASSTLTISELNGFMNKYITAVQKGRHIEEGWPRDNFSPYIVSKIGVSALTPIQQRNFDAEFNKRNISVNAVHPGFVDTDINNHQGIKTPEEGARAPLYLALENHGLRGKFLLDNYKIFEWNRAVE